MKKRINNPNLPATPDEESGEQYKFDGGSVEDFDERINNIVHSIDSLEESLGEIFESDFMYIRKNMVESVERAKDMLAQFGPFEMQGNPKMLESYAKLVDTIINASREQIELYKVLKDLSKDDKRGGGKEPQSLPTNFSERVKMAKKAETDTEG